MPTTAQTTGDIYSPQLVTELFNGVSAHSALAKLSPAEAMPFTGKTVMVFTADGEAQLVEELGAKAASNAAVTPVVMAPKKFIFQKRVSDEFLKAADEYRVNVLRGFNEGFAAKIARGMDIAAIHGLEPSTLTAASFRSTNSFDGLVDATHVITLGTDPIDDTMNAAASLVDGTVNGVALSKLAGAALGNIKANGAAVYPEFRFGQNPAAFAGLNSDVNSTVSAHAADATKQDMVLIGDFANFKWGYVNSIELEVIRYGDPDGAGRDLKRYNEVCLRAEAYIGWGILNPGAFAIVNATI